MPLRRYPAPRGSGEERRRIEAYHATDSDGAAAELVGLPWYAFRDWRRKMGFASKGRFVGPLTPDAEAQRLRAWQQEVFPVEAAKRVGCSNDAMQAWARSRGLPTVVEHAALLRDGLSVKDLRSWEAYCTTRTDLDAGRAVGTTMSAFRRWRIRQGLPGHSHTPAFYHAVERAAKAGNPVAAAFLQRHPRPRPGKVVRRRS